MNLDINSKTNLKIERAIDRPTHQSITVKIKYKSGCVIEDEIWFQSEILGAIVESTDDMLYKI